MRRHSGLDLARVRHLAIVVTPLLLAACGGDVPTAPSTSVHARAIAETASQSIPLALEVLVPCAAGGAGELVTLSGEIHEVFHLTINGNLFALAVHNQPQGVSGVGETTGTKYQGTGVTRDDQHATGALGSQLIFVNNFRVIGQGPGNNFMVHALLQVTVNANGTLTSLVNRATVTCR
jgi:hypothetical protein